jgi:hypothetical protein
VSVADRGRPVASRSEWHGDGTGPIGQSYGRMRDDQADHQWSSRAPGGSAARSCPIRATHSLQIHTATMAEVLGSMVCRLAWKSAGTCSQDLPQNWQRIGANFTGSGGGRLLLVVGLQERCFVPDGVDVGVARGLLGSFHGLPPITRGPHAFQSMQGHDWQFNP